jgi:hypothetical protein
MLAHGLWLAHMLDLTNVFDAVWHNALIYKLNQIELDTWFLKVMLSYLHNRSVFVYLVGVRSTARVITSGVPKRSTLGLVLFYIYINDIPQIQYSHLVLFADDTALWAPSFSATMTSVLDYRNI